MLEWYSATISTKVLDNSAVHKFYGLLLFLIVKKKMVKDHLYFPVNDELAEFNFYGKISYELLLKNLSSKKSLQ
jgi:hypothetical protein